ncbi:MAG: dipeptide ABC transporter ATP-binding protein [Candidatus Omnitrophica bacterium]|nr:dipeptide ABC transporter ATP-binding protein [Candidatus Omnitrophota bacterium]MBD3269274.1 dipeptide ABC transporter ATP-binding protein [Candidatus Omnitrophota bacterium]
MEKLLKVENVVKHFPVKKSFRGDKAFVHALDGVSFEIARGETVGLVGESGCGKSTLARIISGLLGPDSGNVYFEGEDITGFRKKSSKVFRKEIQMIFQDPYASLNPRMKAGDIIGEGLAIHKMYIGKEKQNRVKELLEIVGLNPEFSNRYPHQFSGGQRQRVGIARALSLQPKLIIADEPISALDVSIQAQILNLLTGLQEEFSLAYLFIAHDLRVVKHISDRVIVMYLGEIMEAASCEDIYSHPFHPYTEALLSAIPFVNAEGKKKIILKGDVPSSIEPPSGCRFHTRCPYAKDICRRVKPPLTSKDGRLFSCHFPLFS